MDKLNRVCAGCFTFAHYSFNEMLEVHPVAMISFGILTDNLLGDLS